MPGATSRRAPLLDATFCGTGRGLSRIGSALCAAMKCRDEALEPGTAGEGDWDPVSVEQAGGSPKANSARPRVLLAKKVSNERVLPSVAGSAGADVACESPWTPATAEVLASPYGLERTSPKKLLETRAASGDPEFIRWFEEGGSLSRPMHVAP
jgi:hypothetical protein